MEEQPFLGAGFLFVTVMALALMRLGAGMGGRHWAGAWACLWTAGGVVTLGASVPGAVPVAMVLGTMFATLLYTGTRRFLGKRVPRAVVLWAAAIAVLRAAAHPWSSDTVVHGAGAALITAGALASSVELFRARDSKRTQLLAATFPLAAASACIYSFMIIRGWPPGVPFFIWLMSGILLSGVQVLSLVQRIADRTESERATLASLIESVPVGLALFDRDGALRAANQTFQKLAGLPAGAGTVGEAEVLEALVQQVEPADAEALPKPEVQASGRSNELRFRSGLRITSALHAVTGVRGEATGRLWLLSDVTEQQQLQESLERARRLETLGGFAGGVAHDFNNQLTSVLGNASILRENLAEDHAAQEILADLASSAEYCARLTRDVLDFARRGGGRAENVELAPLLAGVVARRHDGGAVQVRVEPGTPAIRADPTQLERVLENLLDNARDACGRDGSVEIRARRSEETPDRVALEVCDDGPGIDERMRARIFDPFYTTKPVGEGSGLGLAIVYGIVTRQGGEVRVESPPGQGVRLVTTWPVAPAHGSPERAFA